MSRWLTQNNDGTFNEGIISMDECRYLVDEVCCNDQSEQCCDFPHEEYCKRLCPHFTKEDGILRNE